jgi:hypothetical protein
MTSARNGGGAIACAATVVLPIESVVLISISCLKTSCASASRCRAAQQRRTSEPACGEDGGGNRIQSSAIFQGFGLRKKQSIRM